MSFNEFYTFLYFMSLHDSVQKVLKSLFLSKYIWNFKLWKPLAFGSKSQIRGDCRGAKCAKWKWRVAFGFWPNGRQRISNRQRRRQAPNVWQHGGFNVNRSIAYCLSSLKQHIKKSRLANIEMEVSTKKMDLRKCVWFYCIRHLVWSTGFDNADHLVGISYFESWRCF